MVVRRVVQSENRCQALIFGTGKRCRQARYQNGPFCYLHSKTKAEVQKSASMSAKNKNIPLERQNRKWDKKNITTENMQEVLNIVGLTIKEVIEEKFSTEQGYCINALLKTALQTLELRDVVKSMEEAKEALKNSYP